MKFRIIMASILSASSLILINSAFGKEIKSRKIPSPVIQEVNNPILSRGNILQITGTGFVKNAPSVHKAYLVPKKKTRKRRKKIRLKVIEASENNLGLKIPEEVDYNDYNLLIKIKTRLLKSKLERINTDILIRPKAPQKPKLNFRVIESPEQINTLIDNSEELLIEKEELEIGQNQLRAYYTEDGFESIRSEPANFYYIPNHKFIEPLEINSEKPINSLAKSIEEEKVDVSEITEQEILDLEKNFYLVSPTNSKYLLNKTLLSPIFIEELHVKSPEYTILRNRSSENFNMADCYLTDSLKEKYSFEQISLAPKSELKIEASLGLNDTGIDELRLYCPLERLSSELDSIESDPLLKDGFILLDSYEYEGFDKDGFGLKI